MPKKGLIQDFSKPCLVCEKKLGSVSAAISSHMRKHVRDGSMSESKDKDGKLKWTTTGNEPRSKKEFNFRPTPFASKSDIPPRVVAYAKSDKKGNISLKCPKCSKYKSIMIEKTMIVKDESGRKSSQKAVVPDQFVDDRFVYLYCCDTPTIFPKRRIPEAASNPGKETRD